MIPRRDLDKLFKTRILPFKIVGAPNENIPDAILKKMRILLPLFTKSDKISVTKGGAEVPLGELVTTGFGLQFYLERLKGGDYENAQKVKDALEPFSSFVDGMRMASDKFDLYKNVLGFETSDLDSCTYWVEYSPGSRGAGRWGVENLLLVHSHVPEQISVTFDNVTRPAVRVCVPFATHHGIMHVSVGAETLGLEPGGHKSRLDVYVQRHALRRLRERLDCLDTSTIQVQMAASLMEPVVLRQKDGSFLIEYRICGAKAGYLLSDIKDGVLVVRTFLFVTNSGTPEGKKLQEISGVGRLDREFMAIDKLSTFIRADIRNDKGLEALFAEAGCGCLFELHDKVKDMTTEDEDSSVLHFLMKYFGVGEKHDFLMPDPLERWQKKVAADIASPG